MLRSEGFHAAVPRQVRLFRVLDVVIGCEHWLRRIMDRPRANRLELLHHRRGIVMRHHMIGPDRQKITRAQWTAGPFGHVSLRNLLNNCLPHIRHLLWLPIGA
jgi:hypothetical protein